MTAEASTAARERETAGGAALRLRCTACGSPLAWGGPADAARPLECACGRSFPVVGGVPRFVSSEKYVASFGVEWKEFPRTQLDSANGTRISRYRFGLLAGVEPEELRGKRVLEVGCGTGRFMDVLAEAGAEVWGVDLSLAVEVAAENLARHARARVVQADLFRMPFGEDEFDFVYSFGVIHHTPDPRAAVAAMARHLRPGGGISVWVYGRGVSSGIRGRWVPRPHKVYGALAKRLPPRARARALSAYTRLALAAGSAPVVGAALRHVLPVQDLRRRGPLQDGYDPDGGRAGEELRLEWARHSAFDMFTPTYVTQHDFEEAAGWAHSAGLTAVERGPVPTTVRATKPRATPYRQGGDKLHVLFFVSRLNGGGAEMHMLRVMNHLDRSRFRVSLAVTRPAGSFESALAEDVRMHVLGTGGSDSTTVRMLRAVGPLRRLMSEERPDVVCSVMELANIVNVRAARGAEPRPRVVLGVQTPPSIALRYKFHPVNALALKIVPRVYPQADRVVALSRGVAEDVASLAPGVRGRVSVIYNAGVEDGVAEKAREPLGEHEGDGTGPLVVACGRLKSLKGFNYLIDAVAEVRKGGLPARLWIVGEGEERRSLEGQVERLGLGGAVRLLGFQSNPFKFMAAADVFVLSSLFEGFGNVIVEAMACGTPVVATDCPYGPAEIITDGRDGLLVPPADAGALARALSRVLGDAGLRESLAREGLKRAEDFRAETIAGAYGELFREVAGGTIAERGMRTAE